MKKTNKTVKKNNTQADKPKVKKKKKHTGAKAVLYTILLFMFLGIIAVCAIATAFFAYIAINAPVFDENTLYTSEPSVILDAKGNVIANIGTEDRVILSYNELPEVLVNAIVATEDSKFFQHNGIDLPRFMVASFKQVVGGTGGGASTLTMQLSKNFYTSTNDSGWEGIKRKFTDVYMAVFKIEPAYSKEQILEFYVNSFFLGNGYGVEVTSKNYFGKSAKDLNLAEAALIAGLFQAPGTYNPYTNPEATEDRRQTVLYLMSRHGYITDEEYEIAKKMSVEKIVKENTGNDIASGIVNSDYQQFVDMVIKDVREKTGESPYTKSMVIYTTLDPDIQKHVSDIMNGKTYTWENKKVQAGIAVVDINTGAIAAIGGGRNVKQANTFNRATDLNHQIGSTAKPLYDYGPAIEYLNWNTGTTINDAPYTYSNGKQITNADGGYTGYQTITTHLMKSRNIPALKAFQSTSNDDKVKFVTSLGLAPEIYSCDDGYRLNRNKCINRENANDIKDAKITKPLHEAHSIGGYNGESPLDMAAAYSAFGNGGYYNEPYSFTKILYNDTGDVYVNKTETRQVMSDATAYMITYMLQKTAEFGIDTANGLKNINGIPYALKTGTTNFDLATFSKYHLPYGAVNDLWAVGYNTEYAIAVWYGYDKIQDGTNRLSHHHTDLFVKVAKGVWTSKAKFKRPDSIVEVATETNTATSLLPGKNTPSSAKVKSLFISGTEPNKVSTKYDPLSNVANVSGYDNGDGTATISWTKIATPDALNKDYIEGYLDKNKLPGASVSSVASSILGTNKSTLGEVQYIVYFEDNGTLTQVGTTSSDSIVVPGSNGTHKVVVKTAYSKYKGNMSSGESTTVTISGSTNYEPPTDENTEESEENTEEENNEENN
jgi:penicillin-binding protein 1A